MPIAGPPRPEYEIPETVARLAGERAIVPVWLNQLGGVTFSLGDDLHCKWHPADARWEPGVDFDAEAERMAWLASYVQVPEVVEVGADASGRWLVTRSLPGRSAVDSRWKRDPEPSVIAIGRGLRMFHDATPVESCPFDWSIELRVGRADQRSAARTLPDPPPHDLLVVCHGDACAPNTLVADDGEVVGHVDLASVGVADRWADLAVASWSLEWNFGPGWETAFFDAYGIAPDPERIDWYRRLWDNT